MRSDQTKSAAYGAQERKRRLLAAAVLFLLVLLGRAVSYFCTVSTTDIAYPLWVSSASSYLAEAVVAARVALGFALLVRAIYTGRGLGGAFTAVLSAAFADYALRLVIDLLTGAVSSAVMMAVLWLLAQFLCEAALYAVCLLIARFMKRRYAGAETSRGKQKYAPEKAAAAAVFAYLASRVLLEAYYLVDFLLTYSNVTGAETASIVGSFLKIFVIYGGVAYFAASVGYAFLKKGAKTA